MAFLPSNKNSFPPNWRPMLRPSAISLYNTVSSPSGFCKYNFVPAWIKSLSFKRCTPLIRASYFAISSYPCRLRTFPGTSRIMFGASGLRFFSTTVGEEFKSTPRNSSMISTPLGGGEGTENAISPPPRSAFPFCILAHAVRFFRVFLQTIQPF